MYPGKIEAGRVPVKPFTIVFLMNPPLNLRFSIPVHVANLNLIIDNPSIIAEFEHKSHVLVEVGVSHVHLN